MIAQKIYKFNRYKYNEDGVNLDDGSLFLDTIKDWEIDFRNKYPVYYANYLFSNSSTMIIIHKCLDLSSNESCGMDLIDGEIDIAKHLKVDEYSEISTVYGIGSEIEENKDEPLLLVIDDKLVDGIVILKYLPDEDSDEIEENLPVDVERLKVR